MGRSAEPQGRIPWSADGASLLASEGMTMDIEAKLLMITLQKGNGWLYVRIGARDWFWQWRA
ncbi:MAG: hypothetical protein LT106_11345 [Burkholderiaceae bacterium]|nr:hypothetical protein [Burkholderiaceae bacterium]